MKKKIVLAADLFILLLLLSYAIYRDVHLIRQFPADLRNRVVGARLIEDGRLPYFYKWKKGDNTRYLDYNNTGGVKLSNMTASPFMHQLMIPFSDLPQKTISGIWLAFEYLCLFVMICCALLLCREPIQRLLVLQAGMLFLYTEAWINHIFVGQNYLLIAAISALAGLLLVRYKHAGPQVFAGLLVAICMLIRPIYVLFLIPFLFYFPHKRAFLISVISSMLLYVIFLLGSSRQRSLWLDYNAGIKEHIKMHQGEMMRFTKDESLPKVRYLEGYDMEQVASESANNRYVKQSENGNVFVLYKLVTGKMLSLFWLNILCIAFIMLLYWRYDTISSRYGFDNIKAVLFGLSLYMIMEIFLPVHRHQYNTVQFFPLLLFYFAAVKDYRSPAFLLCVAGLLLNVTNTHMIPLRHTIGEALILFAILLTVFKSTKEITNGPKGNYYRSWTSRINGSI